MSASATPLALGLALVPPLVYLPSCYPVSLLSLFVSLSVSVSRPSTLSTLAIPSPTSRRPRPSTPSAPSHLTSHLSPSTSHLHLSTHNPIPHTPHGCPLSESTPVTWAHADSQTAGVSQPQQAWTRTAGGTRTAVGLAHGDSPSPSHSHSDFVLVLGAQAKRMGMGIGKRAGKRGNRRERGRGRERERTGASGHENEDENGQERAGTRTRTRTDRSGRTDGRVSDRDLLVCVQCA